MSRLVKFACVVSTPFDRPSVPLEKQTTAGAAAAAVSEKVPAGQARARMASTTALASVTRTSAVTTAELDGGLKSDDQVGKGKVPSTDGAAAPEGSSSDAAAGGGGRTSVLCPSRALRVSNSFPSTEPSPASPSTSLSAAASVGARPVEVSVKPGRASLSWWASSVGVLREGERERRREGGVSEVEKGDGS